MTSKQKQVISKRIAGCVLGLRFLVGRPAWTRTKTTPSEGITVLETGVLPLDDGSIFSRYTYTCSTNWAIVSPNENNELDSNQRHGDYKSCYKIAVCIFQFSRLLLHRAKGVGAIDETWTRNSLLGRQVLYQLNYYRIWQERKESNLRQRAPSNLKENCGLRHPRRIKITPLYH